MPVVTRYIPGYIPAVSIHERVLAAALSVCSARGGWTFRPSEVAAALPDLNLASVRTHVMSRCCVNAPSHHARRWPYFRRVRRGVYELLPAWRRPSAGRSPERAASRPAGDSGIVVGVRESGDGYLAAVPGAPGTIHASSLDELIHRLRRSAQHDPAVPLVLRIEIAPEPADALIEVYEKDIDRTMIRRALGMTHEERLIALEHWMNATSEIRGAANRPDGEAAT